MPVKILQDNGATATVQYPDGRTAEMPVNLAVEEVQKSYEEPPGAIQDPFAQAMPVAPPAPAPGIQDPYAAPPIEVTNPAFDREWNAAPVAPSAPAAPLEQPVPPQPAQPGPMQVPAGLSGVSKSQAYSFSGQVSNEPVVGGVGPPPAPPSPQQALNEFAQGQVIKAQASEMNLKAQQGLAEERARLSGAVGDQYAEAQATLQKNQALAMRERAQYEANIQEAMSRVAAVDPGRIWTNAGAFGSAMGIMSAAVGGWLQVMHGGPNHAMEAIQKLASQDIQAQEIDIQSQREGVFRAERAAQRGEGYIEDRYRRSEEERMLRLQSLIEASKQRAAQFESPIAQAEHLKFIGALQSEWAAAFKNAGDEFYQQRFNAWQGQEQQRHTLEAERQGRAQISISAKNAETSRRAQEASAKGDEEKTNPYFVDPSTRKKILIDPNVATTEADRSKLAERQALRRSIGQAAKDYHVLAERIGRKYQGKGSETRLGDKDASLLAAKHRDLVSRIVKLRSGSAFTEGEVTNYEKMVGKPPGLTGHLPQPKIKMFLQSLGDEETFEFNGQGALNEDGTPYSPTEWYLKMPSGASPENTSINYLRGHEVPNKGIESNDPAEIAGAIESFTDLMEVPGQKPALRKNFPDLPEEVEASALRAMSDAKASGDMQALQRVRAAYDEFRTKWRTQEQTRGATSIGEDIKDLYGDNPSSLSVGDMMDPGN